MTREEAREEIFAYMRSNCYLDAPSNEACEIAIKALSPVRREQVEKVWRGEWVNTNKEVEQICKCSKCGYPISYFWSRTQFCPNCGAPMTDEAVQTVMERLEKMHEKM